MLWARGETVLIVAPQGVGKTTLGQQLALARIGLREDLLGLPVEPAASKVLYVSADRPAQARRSLARMVSEADREALGERLVVWRGPLPFDLALHPEEFARFIREHGADTVFIDSLKDVALDLSKDETGSRVNLAFQTALADGIEIAVLHHPRKASAQNTKPRSLVDVYGSVWIPAGSGSVVLLWGEAGDLIVELSHLKQPATEVGPLKVLHDHETGTSTVYEQADLAQHLRVARTGLTADETARVMFDTGKPSKNQKEKARRRLEQLVKRKIALEKPGRRGGAGGRSPTRWLLLERRLTDHDRDHDEESAISSTTRTRRSRGRRAQDEDSDHESDHEAGDHAAHPLYKGGPQPLDSVREGQAPPPVGETETSAQCLGGCGEPVPNSSMKCHRCATTSVRPLPRGA